MLARGLFFVAIAIPGSLPDIAGSTGIGGLDGFLLMINNIFPRSIWYVIAFIVLIVILLFLIANRAKALEEEIDVDVLNTGREMDIHQFFDYVGILVGDVSNVNINNAEMALEDLQQRARAGSIKIWGTPNRRGFLGLAEVIKPNHWREAYIYPPDAVENRPPLGISTHRRDGVYIGVPHTQEPDRYDHLYVSASAVRRQFKRRQFCTPHEPSYRANSNGTW